MFFVYDACNFNEFDTEAEAKQAAEAALAEYRSEATDGWHDDAMNVYWGRLSERVSIVSDQPAESGAPFDTLQERELVAVAHPVGHVGYEDVVNIVREYSATMLVGLFAEVIRLCIAKGVFRYGGMARFVARIQAQVPPCPSVQ